jgi:hypothetical protein
MFNIFKRIKELEARVRALELWRKSQELAGGPPPAPLAGGPPPGP